MWCSSQLRASSRAFPAMRRGWTRPEAYAACLRCPEKAGRFWAAWNGRTAIRCSPPEQDYRAIIDEECKVRARTPHVSKFRHMPFDFNDDERCRLYIQEVSKSGRSTGNNMAAFFRATFDAWKDYRRSGRETVYV